MNSQPDARRKTLRIQRTLVVDPKIQMKLLMMTFLTCAYLGGISYACWISMRNEFLPISVTYLGGLAALVFIIYLQLDLSNRILGPVDRMKTEMRNILAGKTPKKIYLRKNDLCKDTIELFNQSVVEKAETNLASPP